MSRNFVYTYFDHVPKIDYRHEHELIHLWKISWMRHGWTPVVLGKQFILDNLKLAEEYKLVPFHEYHTNISRYPSICPAGYDAACFLRWYALAIASIQNQQGALLTTYACMNYGFTPNHLKSLNCDQNKFLMIFPRVPCAMFGTWQSFSNTLQYFNSLNIPNTLALTNSIYKCNWINDMLAIGLPRAQYLWSHKSILGPSSKSVQACDLSDTTFREAILVHFSNYGKHLRGFKTKAEAVYNLRPVVPKQTIIKPQHQPTRKVVRRIVRKVVTRKITKSYKKLVIKRVRRAIKRRH